MLRANLTYLTINPINSTYLALYLNIFSVVSVSPEGTAHAQGQVCVLCVKLHTITL